LTKGKQIYIEGRIQSRSYDDRDGNKRYITEVVANDMQMLGRAGDQGGGGSGRSSSQAYESAGGSQEPPFNPDDDIPF
jgi:single-strand DNA-binding protein